MAKLLVVAGFVGFSFLLFKPKSTGLLETHLAGNTMGTSYHIKIIVTNDRPKISVEALEMLVEPLLEKVNEVFSTYIPGSELSLFNAYRSTKWISASDRLVKVLQASQKISAQTDGAFDATMGPLVNLWGFGPEQKKEDRVPRAEQLSEVKPYVGWKKLLVDPKRDRLRKKHGNMYVDLSAIAKGYGVDEIFQKVWSHYKPKGLFIEVGGEVRARGLNPFAEPWRVGIQNPMKPSAKQIVALRDGSMATSGSYRNFFQKNGKQYSHTIDPRTGRPVTHGLVSVTVIRPECMTADALATAFMVLGPQKTLDFAEKNKIPVYMLMKSGEKLKVEMSSWFKNFLQKED